MRRSSKSTSRKGRPPYKSWVQQFDRDERFAYLYPNTIVSKVAGVTYDDPTTGENRQGIIKWIRKTVEDMEHKEARKITVSLEHVPNMYDSNAVRVHVNFPDRDYWVGFLPKELSLAIAHEIPMYQVVDFAVLGKGNTRHGIQLKIEKTDSVVVEAKVQAKPTLKWSSATEARKALRKKA